MTDPALAVPHPCTLLGAARVLLDRADETVQSQRLKAHAAGRLGYHAQARSWWEQLARAGDAEAFQQLRRMAGTDWHAPDSIRQAQKSHISALMAAYQAAP